MELLPPPQAAMVATQASSTMVAKAYAGRLLDGARVIVSQKAIRQSVVRIESGAIGTGEPGVPGVSGVLRGALCGSGSIDSVVLSVAVQAAGLLSVLEAPAQGTGEPKAVVPFMN